jgi:hypothetical protein
MHDFVPRGFPAYVRIFHPATRSRPVGEPWPGLPYERHGREWDAFQARDPEIEYEDVTWADTARAMGTVMHSGAQWSRLVAPGRLVEREGEARDAAGWRYGDPEEGQLEASVVATALDHLTSGPASTLGWVALWEGFGGLVGYLGTNPPFAFYQREDDGSVESEELARHNEMLRRSMPDPFNNVFRQPTWQEGILSREISEGPRLELPNRAHVLFRGDLAELRSPEWELAVPWRDRIKEGFGFEPSAQSPSIVWPDDRSWVMVTEVDYDSTIVGGSAELIRAICADPRLEAIPITADTDLTWDGDEVNR